MTTAAEDLAKIDSLIAKFKVTETSAETNAVVAPEAKPNTEQEEIALEANDPLTEKEAIQLVQQWAELDEEVDLSERETFEEILKRLKEAARYRTSDLSASRLKEIVSTYAPNAPRSRANLQQDTHEKHGSAASHPYPPELAPLVKSGVARFENGCWFVNRCYGCGQFKNACCGQIRSVSAVRDDGQTFTGYGRQAVGLDPIRPVQPPKSEQQILQEKMANIQNEPWWNQFRGVSELEGDGTLKMYIENFLPEGVTLLCGLYKEGKSFLALSIAKALTSGRPLFERLLTPA